MDQVVSFPVIVMAKVTVIQLMVNVSVLPVTMDLVAIGVSP